MLLYWMKLLAKRVCLGLSALNKIAIKMIPFTMSTLNKTFYHQDTISDWLYWIGLLSKGRFLGLTALNKIVTKKGHCSELIELIKIAVEQQSYTKNTFLLFCYWVDISWILLPGEFQGVWCRQNFCASFLILYPQITLLKYTLTSFLLISNCLTFVAQQYNQLRTFYFRHF